MNAAPLDALVEIGKLGTGWLVAGYLFKKLIDEKDKRLADAQAISDKVTTPIKSLQDTMDAIKGLLQNIVNNK